MDLNSATNTTTDTAMVSGGIVLAALLGLILLNRLVLNVNLGVK